MGEPAKGEQGRSIDGVNTGLKKFGVFASAAVAGLPAGTFFIDHAPPNFAPIVLMTSGLVPAMILLSYIKSPKSDHIVRQSVVRMFIALVLMIGYLVMLQFVTVRPPANSDLNRVQIGFYMAKFSLTEDAKETIASSPGNIEMNVPNDLLLAYAIWGGENDVFTVWKPWTVVLAGLILIALFVSAFCIWAYAFGMMAKYFSPG